MSEMLELVARPGVDQFLKRLVAESDAAFARHELESNLQSLGSMDSGSTVDALLKANFLRSIGSGLGLSQFGHKVSLLIDAMNGADIEHVVKRLRLLEGSPDAYELVRQGMTTRFLNTFQNYPFFGTLYLCSPWINLNSKEAALIRYGVLETEKRNGRRPEILVITRPPEEQPQNSTGSGLGIKPLADMGAQITYVRRVHTKLYIRDPDANGGMSMALVGSENLTQSNHLELGIQINGDTRLIAQLIGHFLEIAGYT